MIRLRLCFLPMFLIAVSGAACASEGAVSVRIDDGPSNHCISPNEKVTVTMRRVVIEKKSKYLGLVEDTNLGLTLTTTVTGASDGDEKSASFTKIVSEQLQQYSAGQVSIPKEITLLSQFSLTNGANAFKTIELDVGLVKASGKSNAAKILMGAVGATSSINMPANPFTTGFAVATTYVKNFVQPLIDQAANEKEATSYTIAMNIGPGNCIGDAEHTGTKAIISAPSDPAAPGAVDIGRIEDYCFAAVLKPVFLLKAGKKLNSQCAAASYKEVSNSYMGFFVNAWNSEPPRPDKVSLAGVDLTPSASESLKSMSLTKAMRNTGISNDSSKLFAGAILSKYTSDKLGQWFNLKPSTIDSVREALERCDANGIVADHCL